MLKKHITCRKLERKQEMRKNLNGVFEQEIVLVGPRENCGESSHGETEAAAAAAAAAASAVMMMMMSVNECER